MAATSSESAGGIKFDTDPSDESDPGRERHRSVAGADDVAVSTTTGAGIGTCRKTYALDSLASDPEGLPGFKLKPETLLTMTSAPSLMARLSGGGDAGSSEFSGGKGATMAEHLRLRVEFQWFLIALSVRPVSKRAMVAHLLPNRAWARKMVLSSSGVKGRCSTWGDSWLHQRRRHDLPDLPGMDLLIKDQFLGPCFWTNRVKASSSSGLHGPLILGMFVIMACLPFPSLTSR